MELDILEKLPEWVVENQYTEDTIINPHDSLRYFLYDEQIKEENDIRYVFKRFVFQLCDRVALDSNSQINITYEPATQHIRFCRFDVTRNGSSRDGLKASKVTILQRERDLERNIMNGDETINIIPDDVKKGDVIDYSYVLVIQKNHANMVPGAFYYFQWAVPVNKTCLRYTVDKGKQFFSRSYNCESEPQIRENETTVSYVWTSDNNEKIILEEDVPSWYDPYKYVQVSGFENWTQVRSILNAFYRVPAESSDRLDEIARIIKRDNHSLHDMILSAYRYIRDNIRYMSISIEGNGYSPKHPDEVLTKGYGDCKDLSLLLVAILNRLDIQAYCCLVHTRLRETIDQYLPNLNLFNHVIVKIVSDSVCYIDPTVDSPMDVVSYNIIPFRRCLVISDETGSLEQMPDPVNEIKVHESFVITKYNGNYEVKTNNMGFSGQTFFWNYKPNEKDELGEKYFEYYKKFYPDIQKEKKVGVVFTSNGAEITENYIIQNIWEKKKRDNFVYFYPHVLTDYKAQSLITKRTMPFYLGIKIDVVSETDVTLPSIWPDFEDTINIENDFFRISGEVTTKADKMKLSFKYSRLRESIDPDHIERFKKAWEDAHEKLMYNVKTTDKFTFSSISFKWKLLAGIIFWMFCAYQFIMRAGCFGLGDQ
jgi:hypothetical protein